VLRLAAPARLKPEPRNTRKARTKIHEIKTKEYPKKQSTLIHTNALASLSEFPRITPFTNIF
jgi:hypothetical protein